MAQKTSGRNGLRANSRSSTKKKFDVTSNQWLSIPEYEKLQDSRKIIARLDRLAKKPYSKWTKADKEFAGKFQPKDIRATKKRVEKTESKGLIGYGNIRPDTAKNLIALLTAYPEVATLSKSEQKNLEYGIHLLKDHKRKAGYKAVVSAIIQKSLNKESGVKKGEWMTETEVDFTTDLFKKWGIAEEMYSAVYGSDVI